MQHKATIFYKGVEGKTTYTFPFSYIRKQFVKVRIDHVNTSTLLEFNRDYTIEGQTLTLRYGYGADTTICIYRHTPTDSLVDFSDSSILLASEMEKMGLQLFHIAEEQNDSLYLEGMLLENGEWQAQGKRITNLASPINELDAVPLKYLDSIGVARQSTLLQIEAAVTEKANQAAESARKSEEVVAQSSNQFNLLIETRFQNLTSLLMQNLSAKYVPQTQASREHQELRTTISNVGIAILQRSKTYAVGDIAYHKALPSWARLECVKAGITGAIEPTSLATVTKAGQVITDGIAVWIVDDLRDGTPVGAVRGSLYLPEGYIKANGATVQRADYPRLVALADKYNLWTDNTAANAGMFGRGNGSSTFVLPNWIDRMTQFANDAGASIAAGLPNISGGPLFPFRTVCANNINAGALFQVTDQGAHTEGGNYDQNAVSIRFDASRSNAVYGRSNTVQPAAIQLIPIIKY